MSRSSRLGGRSFSSDIKVAPPHVIPNGACAERNLSSLCFHRRASLAKGRPALTDLLRKGNLFIRLPTAGCRGCSFCTWGFLLFLVHSNDFHHFRSSPSSPE